MAAKTPTTTGEGRFGQTQIRCGALLLGSNETYTANGRVLHLGSKPPGNIDHDHETQLGDGTGDLVGGQGTFGFVKKYFADIDDGDTWTTGYIGVVLALWQGDGVGTAIDLVNCYVQAGTGELKKGIIEFDTNAGSNQSGWVWVLINKDLNPGVETVPLG
jgi:hypothetical protein